MGITHPPNVLEMGYGFNPFQPENMGTHPFTHGSEWDKPTWVPVGIVRAELEPWTLEN
jgi:hypothetical protein